MNFIIIFSSHYSYEKAGALCKIRQQSANCRTFQFLLNFTYLFYGADNVTFTESLRLYKAKIIIQKYWYTQITVSPRIAVLYNIYRKFLLHFVKCMSFVQSGSRHSFFIQFNIKEAGQLFFYILHSNVVSKTNK